MCIRDSFSTDGSKYDKSEKQLTNSETSNIKSGLVCYLAQPDIRFPSNLNGKPGNWALEVMGGTQSLSLIHISAIVASLPSGRYGTGRECGWRSVAGIPPFNIAEYMEMCIRDRGRLPSGCFPFTAWHVSSNRCTDTLKNSLLSSGALSIPPVFSVLST